MYTCFAIRVSLNVLRYGLPVATVYIPLLRCVGSEPIEAKYTSKTWQSANTAALSIPARKRGSFSRNLGKQTERTTS